MNSEVRPWPLGLCLHTVFPGKYSSLLLVVRFPLAVELSTRKESQESCCDEPIVYGGVLFPFGLVGISSRVFQPPWFGRGERWPQRTLEKRGGKKEARGMTPN